MEKVLTINNKEIRADALIKALDYSRIDVDRALGKPFNNPYYSRIYGLQTVIANYRDGGVNISQYSEQFWESRKLEKPSSSVLPGAINELYEQLRAKTSVDLESAVLERAVELTESYNKKDKEEELKREKWK